MFFLFRMAFWVIVILALLPVFVSHDDPQAQNAAIKFNAGDAVNAATSTMSDLGQFCTRRPETCAIGAQAAAAIGASAQTGVKILYDYIQDRPAETAAAPRTSSTAARKPAPDRAQHDRGARQAANKASRDTLSPTDVAPEWRGPSARKDAGADHPA